MPRYAFSPAVVDCGKRALLTPHLARFNYYKSLNKKNQEKKSENRFAFFGVSCIMEEKKDFFSKIKAPKELKWQKKKPEQKDLSKLSTTLTTHCELDIRSTAVCLSPTLLENRLC